MEPSNLSRRRMLLSTGGVMALAGTASLTPLSAALAQEKAKTQAKALPAYASWKHADSLIVHSANTIETKRSAFGSGLITPLDRLFVRNNVAPPSEQIVADPDAWVLSIKGVKKPKDMSVAELKRLGLVAVPMVLQCSGNGRAFFPEKPSGTQWTVGAAGCVVFTGVPIKAVLEAVGGMEEGAKYMTGQGGEEIPQGLDPNTIMVERSIPLEAIDDAILAWEINGQPIPLAHGGPLRLIVPGYTGVNNVKYIKQLAFTKEQSAANIQQNSYRLAPVGEKSNPNQESVWEMPVKSWVTSPSGEPGEELKAGKVQIQGLAFGGMSAAKEVEVSVDSGKNWVKATFVGPDLGKYAWRQFVAGVDLKPGKYEIASRATSEAGTVQPEERVPNNRGYLNNSWRDHMLAVTVV
ncbi:sulfite oxidase [Alcaligenes phenolicus]|uniref:SorT family sulfite dehydrogenase catalytic subunit n=1 Tax=Alcaligenes phenolicus TaxID=232846 RepID=UPI002D0219F0|nr:sulfite oxidase [Alcaligenes phenolicus]HRO20590.1 sulfite oxidase [Alcaligenes phenolicus]HRP13422.1 sulfite oxidase [Alcaligenes phenolicus]